MSREINVSADEQILLDKIKRVIGNDKNLACGNYHELYLKCLESNSFTKEELEILECGFKGSVVVTQLISKIKKIFNLK